MPVLRSTYRELRTRYLTVLEERDEAVKLAAERLSTITRLSAKVSRLHDEKPAAIVAAPLPVPADTEVRRQLQLARRALADMQQRLDQLQASHVADTRELHDLRQGATS